MSPNDHNFDWVEARHNCSIRVEFEKLRRDVEKATEQQQKLTRDDARFEFYDKDSGFFVVQCFRGHEDETGAVFTRKNGSIEVDAAATKFTVSLTLNDDGECRYRIDDGPQEYLRWQVIRRALQPIFFHNA